MYTKKVDAFDDDVLRREVLRRISADMVVTVADMTEFAHESLEKDVGREVVRQSLLRSGFRYDHISFVYFVYYNNYRN